MAGAILNICTPVAKEFLSPMFVDVSFNFTPFLSQVVAFLISAQPFFPGIFTTYGGACLFIGCTLLSMNSGDQKYLASLPFIGFIESEVPTEEEQQNKLNDNYLQ